MDPFDTRDIGSFLGAAGAYEPEIKGKQSAHEHELNHDHDDFQTSGRIDYVMKLHDDPGRNKNGATLEMEKSNLKLNFSIPPKSGRRFFASCEGNTGFMRQRGFQTSTLSLGYRISHDTAISYDWMTCDGLSKISYGVSFEKYQSRTKIKLRYPSITRTLLEPKAISINNSTVITDKIATEVDMDISVSGMTTPLSKLRIGLRTIHDVVTLPHLQIYIDLFQKTPLTLFYQRYSNEDKQSSKEVMFGLGRMNVQAHVFATQNLDTFTKFSVGVGHSSWEGLSWIFRLQKADLCLNVPIQITPCVSMTYNSLIYSLSTAYLGFFSYCIHLAFQEFFAMQTRRNFQSDLKREEDLLSVEKARHDAENQIMLMKKKADTTRRSEGSKCGLVIEKAIYSVEGGERLDVTVPLQFWVAESKLILSSSSFGSMLGFYKIKARKQARHDNVMIDGSSNIISLLKYLWKETPTQQETIPILYVRYKFNSKTFEIYTSDNEALSLPSPHAKEVQ